MSPIRFLLDRHPIFDNPELLKTFNIYKLDGPKRLIRGYGFADIPQIRTPHELLGLTNVVHHFALGLPEAVELRFFMLDTLNVFLKDVKATLEEIGRADVYHVFKTRQGFHVYGEKLETPAENIAGLGDLLLTSGGTVDIRWVGQSLKQGFCCLRLNGNPTKGEAPEYVETVVTDGGVTKPANKYGVQNA